jgi:hypothetical protein
MATPLRHEKRLGHWIRDKLRGPKHPSSTSTSTSPSIGHSIDTNKDIAKDVVVIDNVGINHDGSARQARSLRVLR